MIKVEIEKIEESKNMQRYPFLGEAKDGAIVLFVSPKTGFLLRCGTYYPRTLGEYRQDWSMSAFEVSKNKLTLSNES